MECFSTIRRNKNTDRSHNMDLPQNIREKADLYIMSRKGKSIEKSRFIIDNSWMVEKV